ncbi:hypothetical protein H5410_030546 [Solanum commersonii]|uniref:Uncharacterized protein n=1 Tax=Solanum commersonii TaxID=4109 RepID=A0A9J5YHP5_SOLCO|nr:hypothetical protein H5410_030546 [Solanum commersonii]
MPLLYLSVKGPTTRQKFKLPAMVDIANIYPTMKDSKRGQQYCRLPIQAKSQKRHHPTLLHFQSIATYSTRLLYSRKNGSSKLQKKEVEKD